MSGASVSVAMTAFRRGRLRELALAIGLVIAAAPVPLFVRDAYSMNVLILTLLYAALSQSWNILSGYCGQISLGHALYFGVGAYTTSLLYVHFGVPPWIGLGAGRRVVRAGRAGAGGDVFPARGTLFHHRHDRDR